MKQTAPPVIVWELHRRLSLIVPPVMLYQENVQHWPEG